MYVRNQFISFRPCIALLLFAVLLLSGCDGTPGVDGPPSDDALRGGPVASGLAEPVEGLRIAPRPLNAPLLPLPWEASLEGETEGIESGRLDGSVREAGGSARGIASPFGCAFSSPAPLGNRPYTHTGIYLHFSEDLLQSATQAVSFQQRLSSRDLYSRTLRDTPVVARIVRCRIPDVPEAHRKVDALFRQFPSPEAIIEASNRSRDGRKTSGTLDDVFAWEGAPVEDQDRGSDHVRTGQSPHALPPFWQPPPWLDASAENDQAKYRRCTAIACESVCLLDPSTGQQVNCQWSCVCTQYEMIQEPTEPGGSDGSVSDPIDSYNPDPCVSTETTQTDDDSYSICDDGSGGPVDPAEPVDVPVSKEEVLDAMQESCNLTEEGRRNASRDGKLFERSVIKSLNQVSPQTHVMQSGTHPQITNEVDGYSTAAFDMDSGEVLNILTSILEVKFSEDSSGGISYGQSETHIEDLASSYESIPPGMMVTGAPLYVIVTNSQLAPNMIGRYSYGAGQYDLPSLANSMGVNMMHYTVVRDGYGGLKLKGDILGQPQTLRSTLQDVFTNFEVSFVINCN